jgi:hypothetical protein
MQENTGHMKVLRAKKKECDGKAKIKRAEAWQATEHGPP